SANARRWSRGVRRPAWTWLVRSSELRSRGQRCSATSNRSSLGKSRSDISICCGVCMCVCAYVCPDMFWEQLELLLFSFFPLSLLPSSPDSCYFFKKKLLLSVNSHGSG